MEESILVGYEMQWTVNFFKHLARKWDSRGEKTTQGAGAYAARQVAFWENLAGEAAAQFHLVNPSFVHI